MYGSALRKGSQIPSLSPTPIPLPPCCKVKAAVSENGHFLHLSLCSEILPQFHLLDKQSKTKEQLSDEKKRFPPLFPTPVPPVFYPLSESLELLQLGGSFHFRLTWIWPACKRLCQLWAPQTTGGGHPSLLPLADPEGTHPCCPAATLPRKGEGTSLWVGWLKYQGYATADDGHKRGSLHQIQNKSRTPCKQHRGSSQNVPFPARAPIGIMELQSRGDLCLHFP